MLRTLLILSFLLYYLSGNGQKSDDNANYADLNQHRYTGDWYMMIGSDPQYPFPPTELKEASDAAKKLHSLASMKASVGTINLLSRITKDRVKGLILNGDLTNNGSEENMNVYQKVYADLTVPLYPGLGNHDFNKADKNALRSIKYLYEAVTDLGIKPYSPQHEAVFEKMIRRKFSDIRSRNPATSIDINKGPTTIKSNNNLGFKPSTKVIGSLAYSWEVGDIHFVQLNNYPYYSHRAAASLDWDVQIVSSLAWLYGDLKQARQRGKQIIVNFHQMGDSDKCHFPLPLDGDLESGANLPKEARQLANKLFADLMNRFRVMAIFVGHQHSAFGITGQTITYHGKQAMNTPVFKCGAIFEHNLFLLEVFEAEYKVVVHRLKSEIVTKNGVLSNPKLISQIDIAVPITVKYQ